VRIDPDKELSENGLRQTQRLGKLQKKTARSERFF